MGGKGDVVLLAEHVGKAKIHEFDLMFLDQFFDIGSRHGNSWRRIEDVLIRATPVPAEKSPYYTCKSITFSSATKSVELVLHRYGALSDVSCTIFVRVDLTGSNGMSLRWNTAFAVELANRRDKIGHRLALDFAQMRIPAIHDQHHPRALAAVPRFVLEGVIERDAAAFLPYVFLTADTN